MLFTPAHARRGVVNADDPWGRRLLGVPRSRSRPSGWTPQPTCGRATWRWTRAASRSAVEGVAVRATSGAGSTSRTAGGDRRRPGGRGSARRGRARRRRCRGCPAGWSRSMQGRTSWWWWTTRTRRIASAACSGAARCVGRRPRDRRVRLRGRPRPREATPDGAAATADADLDDHHERQPPLRGPAGDHRRDRRAGGPRRGGDYVVEPDRRAAIRARDRRGAAGRHRGDRRQGSRDHAGGGDGTFCRSTIARSRARSSARRSAT